MLAACAGSAVGDGALVADFESPIVIVPAEVGDRPSVRVRLRNTGSGPAALTRIDVSGAFASRLEVDAPLGLSVAEGAVVELGVRYDARDLAAGEASIAVVSGGATVVTFEVMVRPTAAPRDGGVEDAAVDEDGGVRDAGHDGGVRDAGRDAGTELCFADDDVEAVSFPPTMTSTRTNENPEVAYGAGEFVAVWRSFNAPERYGFDPDLFWSRSSDGVTWDRAAAIEPAMAIDGRSERRPRLVSDGRGTWLLVWEQNVFGGTDRIALRAARRDANGWAPSTEIFRSNVDNEDAEHALATDGFGTSMVVWRAYEGDGASGAGDIVFSVARGNPAWTAPRAIIAGEGDTVADFAPSIVAFGRSSFLVAWHSPDDDTGFGFDDDIFYTRTTDAGETWEPVLPLRPGSNVDSNDEYNVQLIRGPNGTIIALAIGDPGEQLLSALSDDDGATWGAHRAIAGGAEWDAAPYAVANGTGSWRAMYHSHPLGPAGGILVVPSEDDARTWAPERALHPKSASDDYDDFDLRAVTDGVRRTFMIWTAYPEEGPGMLRSALVECTR